VSCQRQALELRVAAKDHTTADGSAWVKAKEKKAAGTGKKLTDFGAPAAGGKVGKGGASPGAGPAAPPAADLLDMLDEPAPPPKVAATPPSPAPKAATSAAPAAAPAAAAAAAPPTPQQQQQPPPPPQAAAPPPVPVAAAAGSGGTVGIGADSIPAMRGWFNALVLGPQGVLFEDAHVQVRREAEQRARRGRTPSSANAAHERARAPTRVHTHTHINTSAAPKRRARLASFWGLCE